MSVKFADIVTVIALVRTLNSGQSIEQVAAASQLSPQTIRGKLRAAGYVKLKSGKWITR